MSCSLSFHIPKALPSLIPRSSRSLLPINSLLNQSHNAKQSHSDKLTPASLTQKQKHNKNSFQQMKSSLAIQVATLVATVHEQPALAITGVNKGEDMDWVLTQVGIIAFLYLLVAPPLIMNWMRKRWYKRNVYEMYLQFMFTFLFFPGILIWAPFVNVRRFPRDPSMKFPWSVPKDPSKIKIGYLKYPFAQPEDYEVD
uniref:NADH dehydrogenase-like complex L n=1 Tax=Pelargonium myrrhifolium TaxID=253081 RepID=A0A0F7CYY1_9ROSI